MSSRPPFHHPADPRPRREPVVVFVAHLTERSGAPRVTVELARRVAEAGRRVVVVFPERGGLEEDARRAGLRTVVVPNMTVSLRDGGAKALAARLRAIRAFRRLAAKPSVGVLWIGTTVLWPALIGARLASRPAIVHVHEDPSGTTGGRVRTLLVRRMAQALVFVARGLMPAYMPQPCRQEWLWLPNLIAEENLRTARRDDSLRRELGAGREDDFVFLNVGFLHARKGQDVLLRAFARVARKEPRARLWLAGPEGDPATGFSAKLRGLVQKHGLQDKVRFLGYRDDAPRLMASADTFVMASRNEALPLTLGEALLAGCPVITTRVGAVADLLGDPPEGGLIVPPEDPAALEDAMLSMMRDGKLRRGTLRAGKRAAQNWNAAARDLRPALGLIDTFAPSRSAAE